MGSFAGKFCGLGAAALLIGSSVLAAQTVHRVEARVVSQVRESELTPLQGNSRIAQIALADLGAVAGDLKSERMILQLNPSDAQKSDLTALVAAQMDPSSAQFRKWLTPAEFGARFGVAQADIDKVTSWLAGQGFRIDEVPAGHQTIVFSGTVSQIATAFHTQLHRYQLNTTTPLANDANPQVPSALAPVITGFASLSDTRRVAMHHDIGTFTLNSSTGAVTPKTAASDAVPTLASSAGADGPYHANFTYTNSAGSVLQVVTPYDFATIYDLKPLWAQGFDGTGQTIAIISPSDLNQSDVDAFRAQFGLPATRMNKFFASTNPGITTNVNETALDVEWSGAVAKGATIDLIVGATSLTADGVDAASLYAVNNNIAPIISVSYGECEAFLGASGNAFYNSLWQQAAAQGQSVFISSGDAGATTCDQGNGASTKGIMVNGLSSTPYNVSVGGTDLYGTFTSKSTYWNTTNDSNLATAKSYVPEAPWNDSCGNPLILAALVAKGYTDTSTAALCNNSKVTTSNYRVLVGGGGGVSNCIATTDGTIATCTGGYAQPSWQKGVGVPANGARNLPDVSLMSGDGIWGSFMPYCLAQGTTSGSCNLTNIANIEGGGGTSFAAPQFAGILAIVNQKTSSIQGNPNPIFYALAASTSSLNCSSTDPNASTSCIFHDAQIGGNAQPCYALSSTGARDCTTSVATNTFGVTSGNAATVGYDKATGLGSVDITNLVNAWGTALSARAATTTTFTLNASTAVYGVGPTATVHVTSATGVPTGDFSVLPSSTALNASVSNPGTLINGTGTTTMPQLPVGNYTLRAHYTGDTGFNASDSAALPIVITQAPSQTKVTPTRASLTPSQSTSLQIVVTASGLGAVPTGTVHVVNTTSGVDLGTYAFTSNAVSPTYVSVNLAPAQLVGGTNALAVTYSGDTNYATSSTTVTLTLASPLAMTLSTSNLTLTTTATTVSGTSNIALVAANGGTLAYPITLSCTGTLPAGATCSLNPVTLASPVTTAVATVSYTQPLLGRVENTATPWRTSLMVPSLAGLSLLFFVKRRRLRGIALSAAIAATALFGGMGCSSSGPITFLTVSSSTQKAAYGSSVTFIGNVNTSTPFAGPVSLTDTYHGTARTLGSFTVSGGTGTMTTSSLGIGSHSVVGIYSGFPQAVSAPTNVQVTSTSNLQIKAVDANGLAVVAPLTVTLQ